MTEEKWLNCTNSQAMLDSLRGKVSDRKLRLTGCACARRTLQLVGDEHLAAVLSLAKRIADGNGDQAEVQSLLGRLAQSLTARTAPAERCALPGVVFAAAHPPGNRHFLQALTWLACGVAWAAVPTASIDPDDWESPRDPAWNHAFAAEVMQQADAVRDIFGNPFRPVSFSPSWRTGHAVALALAMYESRDFSAMLVLADALIDAGCTDDQVHGHCRSDGPHARGCWVVDLLLGKD